MPTREQLESALRNAHKAGDVGAAKKLANALKLGQFDQAYAKSASEVPITGFGGQQIPATPADPVETAKPKPYEGVIDYLKRAPSDVYATAEDVAQTGGAILSGIGSDILGKMTAIPYAYGGKETPEEVYQRVVEQNQYVPSRQGAQQMLGSVAKTLEPLASLPPVLGVASPQIAATASAKSMAPKIPEPTPKGMQRALDINRGVVNTDLAPLMTTAEKPMAAVSDPIAKRAISAGLPEGFVDAAKKMNTADKKKIIDSLDIIDRGIDDPTIYGKNNRASDVIGDSLAQRIDVVKDINKKAGMEVKKESKKLVGKPIDYEPVFGGAIAKLEDDLRVRLDDDGVPIFERSAIGGLPNDEKLVSQVVGRMRSAKTAIDLHDLKKYIQDNVSYGKQKEGGIRPQTEVLMKDFAREINGLLAENFPEYGAANKTYSDTIDALGDMQKRAGTIDIYNESASALGSKLRMVLSDAPGREPLKQAVQKIDDVAKQYGAKFDDDLSTQINMVDDLERIFKISSPKGFEGGVTRAGETVQSLRQKGAAETIFDAALEPAIKPFRKSEKQKKKEAIQAIRELLERK